MGWVVFKVQTWRMHSKRSRITLDKNKKSRILNVLDPRSRENCMTQEILVVDINCLFQDHTNLYHTYAHRSEVKNPPQFNTRGQSFANELRPSGISAGSTGDARGR